LPPVHPGPVRKYSRPAPETRCGARPSAQGPAVPGFAMAGLWTPATPSSQFPIAFAP
jgi:hypothetical protein